MQEILQADFFSTFTSSSPPVKEQFSVPRPVSEVSVGGNVWLTQNI